MALSVPSPFRHTKKIGLIFLICPSRILSQLFSVNPNKKKEEERRALVFFFINFSCIFFDRVLFWKMIILINFKLSKAFFNKFLHLFTILFSLNILVTKKKIILLVLTDNQSSTNNYCILFFCTSPPPFSRIKTRISLVIRIVIRVF